MAKTESKKSEKKLSSGGAPPRLKEKYRNEVLPKMIKEFSYRNQMQVPRLDRVVVIVGMGEALSLIHI